MKFFGRISPALFFAIAAAWLGGCNLSVLTPEPESPPASATPMPTHTIMLLPSFTSTVEIPPSPSPTGTASFVTLPAAFTPVTLTLLPTMTPFYTATATPTPQWAACPGIVVTPTDTNAGNTLHVLRCDDGLEYDLGPLAQGTYAVSPNDKFLVYVTVDGMIYAAKIGDRYLTTVFNLKTERIYTALNKGVNGDFKISFTGGELNYQLVLLERKYDQKRVYDLPVTITRH